MMTTAQLIDTTKLTPSYTSQQSESDFAATGYRDSVRVFSVTVHDQRGNPIWDKKAWLVEHRNENRFGHAESVDQKICVTERMPKPRLACKFGDSNDKIQRADAVHLGSLVIDGETVVLRKTMGDNVVQYSIEIEIS